MGKYKITLEELHRRDKGICSWCLEPVRLADATRDHIIPQEMLGSDNADNLVLAHEFCNTERASKSYRLKPLVSKQLTAEDVDDYERGLIKSYNLRKKLNTR